MAKRSRRPAKDEPTAEIRTTVIEPGERVQVFPLSRGFHCYGTAAQRCKARPTVAALIPTGTEIGSGLALLCPGCLGRLRLLKAQGPV
jgi:hypothetical protein